MTQISATDRLLEIPEAQDRLGKVGRTLFFSLLKDGSLGSVKIGRRRLIPESAIAEFIDRLRAEQDIG